MKWFDISGFLIIQTTKGKTTFVQDATEYRVHYKVVLINDIA